MLDALLQEFIYLIGTYESSNQKIQKLFHILASYYLEEERHYHNLNHIFAMLDGLKKNSDIVKDYLSVYLAVWFHDAIYDSRSSNNEERSAEFAASELQKLKLPEDKIKFCCELILSTKFHVPARNCEDCDFFLDLDLSILGREPHVYEEYAQNVRKEYIWVPEETFLKGRYNVLNQILSRDRIYNTERFYNLYEVQARSNIQAEITEIKQRSPIVLA